MIRQRPKAVDLLILGAGWTSTFLIAELDRRGISHAATTTTGRNGTIPFRFDPDSTDIEPYAQLPQARTVLITFPLKGAGQSKLLTSIFRQVHGDANHWIQLGSSGIFKNSSDWITEDSEYDTRDVRAIAEDELRACVGGCVLNLVGLYSGESRSPRTWIPRLAKSKEDVRARNSVHFIHGEDVARAIVATHFHFTEGKRWIVGDLRVYDWYDLIMSFSFLAEGDEDEEMRKKRLQFGEWVGELMVEEGVRALPRSMEVLGRKLDSRGFWEEMGIWPRHARLA